MQNKFIYGFSCFASFDKIWFLKFGTNPKEIQIFVIANFLQKLNENNRTTEFILIQYSIMLTERMALLFWGIYLDKDLDKHCRTDQFE